MQIHASQIRRLAPTPPRAASSSEAAPAEGNGADAAADLRTLISDVRTARTTLDQAQGKWRWTDSDLSEVGRNFSDTRWPLRRAEADTTHTDVSQEGWELDRLTNSAERALDRADRNEVDGLQMSQGVDRDLTGIRQRLAGLRQDLAAGTTAPQILADLDAASQSLSTGQSTNAYGCQEAANGHRQNEGLERNLQQSDYLVNRIRWDRVGTDVSFDARQLSSKVNTMEWDLRDSQRNNTTAIRYSDSAEQKLLQAEQDLGHALTLLTAPRV